MAAANPRRRLRDEATCVLCLDFFTDPLLLECGHSFCRACISPSNGRAATTCPQCNEAVLPGRWKPNRQLANVAEIARELTGEAGRTCLTHCEPLKLFCKDDRAPLCVVCGVSKEHRDHAVVPAEEAAQEFQVQICRCLAHLRREREKILACKRETEKESEDLLKQTEAEKQKTMAEFRALRQFLEEQENLLLAQMKGVEEEIVKKREEHLVRISEELSSLDEIIQKLEEKSQQIASELLQGVTNILQSATEVCILLLQTDMATPLNLPSCERYEQKEKFKNRVAFPSALKWKVWEFRVISPKLQNIVKKLEGTFQLSSGQSQVLLHENQLHKENVTLDPDSAHPHLLISNDWKCLTLGDQWQSLPADCQRFRWWPCARGKGSLKSQMHYWEVEVGNEGWAVGICKACTVLQRDEFLGPETGVWAIGKWSGEYRTVSYPYNPPLSVSGELKKIRVLLNFPEKQVSFFDADTAALLHISTIPAYPAFQPFFWLLKKSHLRICP